MDLQIIYLIVSLRFCEVILVLVSYFVRELLVSCWVYWSDDAKVKYICLLLN